MKEQRDINFISLLEDEDFLDLARNFDVTDIQIRNFIALHPEKEEEVKIATAFLKSSLSDQRTMAAADVSSVWQEIRQSLNRSLRATRVRRIWNLWSGIAAIVAVVIAGVAGGYYFYQVDDFRQMVASDIEVGKEAVIVLSDGTLHRLKENDTHIEYSADGTEVIVKDHVQEQEKLENTKLTKSGSPVNQIVVPYGRRHVIILSDGTRVHLNSGSMLIYPAGFHEKKRKVYLKGEGYFEVSANPEQPFIVETEHVEVRVLGTSFNISAYTDEETVSAILVEGKVKVRHRNEVVGYSSNELIPGQGLFYSVKNATAQLRAVDVMDFVSWKDGLFHFNGQTLDYVLNRVQKYYNCSIRIENQALANTVISGKLVLSDDFDKVMEFLSRTIEGRYIQEDDQSYLLTD